MKENAFGRTFGLPASDRRTIERSSDEWITTQRASPHARFIVMSTLRILVDTTPALVRVPVNALPAGWMQWQTVYLGHVDDVPLFALDVPASHDAHFLQYGAWSELRPVALSLNETDAALTAHARAVLHWHVLNRYCGACGGETVCAAAGHARRCGNTNCIAREIFPRIDPAIIVLVTHGDHCLLGRQRTWPPGRYSCLAGFAEAGETLEETVRREVFEESGVRIGTVTYQASQPWPFPQSLMLGFRARATATEITLHDDELEDARWFARAQIRDELAAGTLRLSAPLSIAYRLLRDWYAEDGDPDDLDRHATE